MLARRRKWLMVLSLLITGLLLVACGAEEEGAGGGLTEDTPMGTEQVPGLEGEVTPTEAVPGLKRSPEPKKSPRLPRSPGPWK